MTDKLEKEINLYSKIIVKNYNDLSLAEQFEKGVVVKVDDELAKVKRQLDIACNTLALYVTSPYPNPAKAALERIAELGGDYSHYFEKQIKELEK